MKGLKRTAAPRRASRWRLVIGLGGLAALVLGLGWLGEHARDPESYPITKVAVRGELRHLDGHSLERKLNAAIVNGSFFSLDLEQVRRRIVELPWADKVWLRRVWPGTLEIHVEEQVAFAYWGEQALVNPRGEIFQPARLADIGDLPRLHGSADQAKRVVARFKAYQGLLQVAGHELRALGLSERLAWRLVTRDGMRITLGRRDALGDLQRFLAVLPVVREQGVIRRADLRYEHGLALEFAPAEATAGQVQSQEDRS